MSPTPRLEDFDYELPDHCIAQVPCEDRTAARLLVLDRSRDTRTHGTVRQLPDWLMAGDLLVRNATRVVPARLRGHKETGGAAEALLLDAEPLASEPVASELLASEPGGTTRHRALVRCGGRLRIGQKFHFSAAGARPDTGGAVADAYSQSHSGRHDPSGPTLDAELLAHAPNGEVILGFAPGARPLTFGETPLPPYIRRETPDARDEERYQTVYARVPGSVAAPTAGLHFSDGLFSELEDRGVELAEVVLHVGAGTFRPPRPEDLAAGRLHREPFELPAATADAIARTRARGGRVIAVGTTTTRVLESCAEGDGEVRPARGETDLLLHPGTPFRVVDALLTNFHLPRSSLLMLVAAFAGRERILASYAQAAADGYRFYSYGDAMLIL